MAACLAQHKDPYSGEHMGLWGGHTQVVDHTSQWGPDKGAGQTWSKAPCCTDLWHTDLGVLVLLKRARSFGLCTSYASRKAGGSWC